MCESGLVVSPTRGQEIRIFSKYTRACELRYNPSINGLSPSKGGLPLRERMVSRNPWVHGKTLIDGTNSQATRLRDVFKNNRDWQKIIVSNKRGYYRLNLADIEVQATVDKVI